MIKIRLIFLWLLILVVPGISVYSQSADQLYSGGHQAFIDELWQTASSRFSRLLLEYPEDLRNDSAAYMGAVAYYNDGKYQQCITVLTSFPLRYPDSAWNQRVAYWEGLARYELNDWSGAESAFERQSRMTEDGTYRERSLLYLGACRENLDKTEMAEKDYLTLIKEGKDHDLVSRAVFRLGQIRLADHRPKEALDAFNQLAYEYPTSTMATDSGYWIAEAQRRLGQDENALNSYRNFLTAVYSSPYRLFALLETANLASKAHYDHEALAYLDLRDEELPPGIDEERSSVLKIRAVSYMRTGQIAKARNAYTAILKNPANKAEEQVVAFNLAQTWLGGKDVLSAIPYLERAGKGPDKLISADSLYLAGTILLHSKNSRGTQFLQQFVSQFPQDKRREEALRLIVRIWQDKKNLTKAVESLNLLVHDYPTSDAIASYLFLRGEMTLQNDDSSSALRDYGTIIKKYKNSDYALEAYSRIGFIYSERKEFIRAADYYKTAGEMAGGLDGGEKGRRALYSSGIASLNGGNTSEAVRILNSLVQSNPLGAWSVEAAFHMGEALYDMEKYPDARRAYETSARYGDSDWTFESLYGIGWTWFRELDWVHAVESFKKAAEAAENSEQQSRARYRVGLSLASAGEWKTALDSYNQALSGKLGRLKEEVLYQKAWALFNLDRADNAHKTARLLAKEFPESELPADLPFRMGENAMESGKYADALIWYDQCQNEYPDSDIAVRAELRAALAASEGGNALDAAHRYEAWVIRRPRDPGAATAARSWAGALKDAGNPDVATQALNMVLAMKPIDHKISSPIILAWARITGILPESRSMLEKIADDQSLPSAERAEALLLIAHRYRMDGNPGRAKQLYEVLVRDIPGRIGAEAQEGMADSLVAEGNIDAAAEAYLAVPYLFPDQVDFASRALREAEKLYRKVGRDDEADKIRSRF